MFLLFLHKERVSPENLVPAASVHSTRAWFRISLSWSLCSISGSCACSSISSGLADILKVQVHMPNMKPAMLKGDSVSADAHTTAHEPGEVGEP